MLLLYYSARNLPAYVNDILVMIANPFKQLLSMFGGIKIKIVLHIYVYWLGNVTE